MNNPFTSLPPRVRQGLYLLYAVAGLIFGALQVYGTEDVGSLDVGKALEVLAYVGIPFGFVAASNVPSYEDVVDGDAAPPDRGEIGLVAVLVIVLVVAVIFAITRAL